MAIRGPGRAATTASSGAWARRLPSKEKFWWIGARRPRRCNTVRGAQGANGGACDGTRKGTGARAAGARTGSRCRGASGHANKGWMESARKSGVVRVNSPAAEQWGGARGKAGAGQAELALGEEELRPEIDGAEHGAAEEGQVLGEEARAEDTEAGSRDGRAQAGSRRCSWQSGFSAGERDVLGGKSAGKKRLPRLAEQGSAGCTARRRWRRSRRSRMRRCSMSRFQE